ncbi:GAF domain-containing protein [Antrihabitans sp. YC2-6]|nr:GAF domain-containing protein [Antrihabitans sp. YC2-6]
MSESRNGRHNGIGVYRLPMRSRRPDVVPEDTFDYARKVEICGSGGQLDDAPPDLEEALSAMSEKYDERTARRLERFARLPDGSFVWTKSDGWYFLGRIDGPWRYDDSAPALRVDLVHVRPCSWVADALPEPAVPSAVVATFARGGRNFQEIHHTDVLNHTRRLWRSR